MTSVVVSVAGGSASGKSAVVRALVRSIHGVETAVLPHDAYYHDLSHMPFAERRKVNVDHPDSLETGLMVRHLERLLRGEPIERPVYDYAEHVRLDPPLRIEPAPVVVVEGILVLSDPRLRALTDLGVFVDVPEQERLARRLRRDVRKRGRTAESVRRDHVERVQPMHEQFVAPSRAFADVVIREGGHNAVAIRALADRVALLVGGRP